MSQNVDGDNPRQTNVTRRYGDDCKKYTCTDGVLIESDVHCVAGKLINHKNTDHIIYLKNLLI